MHRVVHGGHGFSRRISALGAPEEFDTGTATRRLMLTLLSGFAAHERDMIRERSVAGTNRVAEGGAWLGGIVPCGYRKVGEKRNAHLVISEDPIPGLAMSEAEVIRLVFRMAAVQRKSCRVIAARLNDLRIPCAYVRDDRLTLRGKRKQRTSGVWRPGRIRGLIKCGLCGLTYIGVAANRPNGRRVFYYCCNGAHSPSVYSNLGRCHSKAVRGDHLEQQVWSDVETFLRNPEPVLQQLHARLESDAKGSDQIRKQVARLEGLLAQKATERSRVVGLHRRSRLTEVELDAQPEDGPTQVRRAG